MTAQQPVIANYKIFAFVGFICAALITSLFVYRTTHLVKTPNLQDDNVLIMPAGRDLKSIDLMTTSGEPFTQRNLFGHWTILFFGFTHCNSVCPVTMGMLSKAYPDLEKAFPNLQVVLVSLDPERDTKVTLQKYTHNFNPAFMGVSGKIESIRKLQSIIGVYSAVEGDKKTGDYQLQHTSSIMLINPEGKWVAMYRYGMTPTAFTEAVKRSVALLQTA